MSETSLVEFGVSGCLKLSLCRGGSIVLGRRVGPSPKSVSSFLAKKLD